MSPPDSPPGPVRLLQRIAANTGRTPPADLVGLVYEWVSSAAVPILNGEPADVALSLRVPVGARSLSRTYRQSRRNDALTRLYCLASGSRIDRGEQVLALIDAHRDGYPVPDVAREHLNAVLESGLPVLTNGLSVARIAGTRAAVAPASPSDDDCGSITPEAPPIAATDNRP